MSDLNKKIEAFKNKIGALVKNKGGGKNFEYLYNHGIDLYNNKSYEKAITLFKQAIDTPDVQPQVYYNLGLSYQYIKSYENAIET